MNARHPRLMYFVTEDWYFVSHRLPLAKRMIQEGFDVSVVTRINQHAKDIQDAGIKIFPLNIHRSSLNIVRELGTLLSLMRIYARERPDIVHHVAMKPVVYGSIAARLTGINNIVNALAGLGFVFSSQTAKACLLRPFVRKILKLVLSGKNTRLILQNRDDMALFAEQGLIDPSALRLIRGSGVDPSYYPFVPEPEGQPPLVVLPARMLRDKGIVEFVEAARLLRQRGIVARLALVGKPDPYNPASLTEKQLQAWHDDKIIEYWGWRDDMSSVLAKANVVCLPSYREGLPKALLEAAACGRAMVATDVPGCREIVRPQETGWLVPPENPEVLADVLQEALLRPGLRSHYGQQARALVEKEFSIQPVSASILTLYHELIG